MNFSGALDDLDLGTEMEVSASGWYSYQLLVAVQSDLRKETYIYIYLSHQTGAKENPHLLKRADTCRGYFGFLKCKSVDFGIFWVPGMHKKLFPTSMGMVLLKQWHMEPRLPWRHLTTRKGHVEKK